jgi:hypothetical protein
LEVIVADESLPKVGTTRLTIPLQQFERLCLLRIKGEQEKPNPDNSLVTLLCHAVGLAREYSENFDVAERVVLLDELQFLEILTAPKTAREFDQMARNIADAWFEDEVHH